MFPYHRVPDGSVFVPHHLIWALLGALVPLAMVWDNHPTKEPVYAVMAVLVALVAFVLVWPTHHVLGAALAVAATVAAVLVLAVRLGLAVQTESPVWPPLPLAIALVLAVVALDDVLQHAFGWGTPLDAIWKHHLRPRLPSH